MRTNRHFYPQNDELVFTDGLSHIEETANRHQQRILLWQESLLQTYLSFPYEEERYLPFQAPDSSSYRIQANLLDPLKTEVWPETPRDLNKKPDEMPFDQDSDIDQMEEYGLLDIQGHFFMSHELYTTQFAEINNPDQGVAIANTVKNSQDQINQAKRAVKSPDSDFNNLELSDKLLQETSIDSNRVKIGLKANQEFNNEKSKSNFRQSQYFSAAFDLNQSVELPIDQIEKEEKIQIVDSMLEKIALYQHNDNYYRFKRVFGNLFDENNPNLSSHFFTVDPIGGNGHPTTHKGKLLSSVEAQDIEKLDKDSKGFSFFFQNVDIAPKAIVINQQMQLEVIKREMKITNRDSAKNMTINDIFASTPEVFVFHADDQSKYPIELQPGQSHTVQIYLIPETLGLIQGCVYLLMDEEFVFMAPISVFVIKNAYGLEPFYYTGVTVNQTILSPIRLTNIHEKGITISEAYSTEEFLTLEWPSDERSPIDQEQLQPEDLSEKLSVGPKETKTLFKAVFETQQLVDHAAHVHLLTSNGHVFRVPLYYHLYIDDFTFKPSIADFGVIPLNFDVLRIPVTVKVRSSSFLKNATLTNVLYPIDDQRVQFATGKWSHANQEDDRFQDKQNVVQKDRELDLFTIFLQPNQYGMIQSSVKIILSDSQGQITSIDFPIKGIVVPMHHTLVESDANNFLQQTKKNNVSLVPFLPPSPAFDIDLSGEDSTQNVTNQDQKVKVQKSIRNEQLILKNFFETPLKNVSIVSIPENFAISYNSQDYIEELQPAQTVQFAQFTFNTSNFNVIQGRLYFFLKANDTFLPQYIQLDAYRILCSVQEDYQPERFSDNFSETILNFGKVGMYQQKERRVKITNLSQKSVFLTWANKTHPGDELTINYEEDSFSRKIKAQDAFAENFVPKNAHLYDNSNPILDRFTDKKRVGIFILPGRSIIFNFSLEGTMASLVGGRPSSVQNHKIQFQFQPQKFKTITISYSYQFVPGSAKFTPKILDFDHQIGAKQSSQLLNLSSVFEIPLLLKSIESSDKRFVLETSSSIVEPFSKHEFKLTFDPRRSKIPNQNYTLKVTEKKAGKAWQTVQNIDFYDLNVNDPENIQSEASENSDEDMSQSQLDRSVNNLNKFLEKITSTDILLWRQRNKNQQKNHKQYDQTTFESEAIVDSIEAEILVKTNILDQIRVPVKATIKEPLISKIKVLNFGRVQIGSAYSSPLEFFNPFNQTLHFTLFLGKNIESFSPDQPKSFMEQISYDMLEGKSQEDQELINQILSHFEFNRSKFPHITSQCEAFLPEFIMSFHKRGFKDLFGSNQQPVLAFELYIYEDNKENICKKYFYLIFAYDQSKHGEKWDYIEQFFQKVESDTESIKLNEQVNGSRNQTEFGVDQESHFYERIFQNYQIEMKMDDFESLDDELPQNILTCTQQEAITMQSYTQQLNLNMLVAFPNPFYYGNLKFVLENFSLQGILRPFINFRLWIKQRRTLKDSWFQICDKIMTNVIKETSKTLKETLLMGKNQGNLSSKYLSRDFVLRQPTGNKPAAALFHEWELLESSLHDEILQNNGTFKSEINKQHFFINSAYHSHIFSIEPGESLLLPQLILFEPHSFSSKTNPMHMTLFVKSDQTILQTVELVGHASSTILDFYKVNKRIFYTNQKYIIETTNIADYSSQCKSQNVQKNDCLQEEQMHSFVEEQVLGRSSLTSQLNLRVNTRDLLIERHSQDLDSTQKSYFGQVYGYFSSFFASDFSSLSEKEYDRINNVFVWEIFLHNLSSLRFWATSIYLEDPISGQQFCSDGSLMLNNCQERDFLELDELPIKLKYVSDFTVTQLKVNLVIKSIHLQQRFQICIDIEPEAIRLSQSKNLYSEIASQNQEAGQIYETRSEFDFQKGMDRISNFMLWISLIIIGYHLVLKIGEDRILATSFDRRVSDVENSNTIGLQASDQQGIERVQRMVQGVASIDQFGEFIGQIDKLENKQAQFFKDCFTLSQKKNSVTLEYQRSLQIVASASTKSLERAARLINSQTEIEACNYEITKQESRNNSSENRAKTEDQLLQNNKKSKISRPRTRKADKKTKQKTSQIVDNCFQAKESECDEEGSSSGQAADDSKNTDELLRRAFADRKQCIKDSKKFGLQNSEQKSQPKIISSQACTGESGGHKNDTFMDVRQNKSFQTSDHDHTQLKTNYCDEEPFENKNLLSQQIENQEFQTKDDQKERSQEANQEDLKTQNMPKQITKQPKEGIARLSKKDAKKYEARKARSEALAENSRLVKLAKQAEEEKRLKEEQEKQAQLIQSQKDEFSLVIEQNFDERVSQNSQKIQDEPPASDMSHKIDNGDNFSGNASFNQTKKIVPQKLYEDQILEQVNWSKDYLFSKNKGSILERLTNQDKNQEATSIKIPAVEKAAHQFVEQNEISEGQIAFNPISPQNTTIEPDISIIEPRSGGFDDSHISKNYWDFREENSPSKLIETTELKTEFIDPKKRDYVLQNEQDEPHQFSDQIPQKAERDALPNNQETFGIDGYQRVQIEFQGYQSAQNQQPQKRQVFKNSYDRTPNEKFKYVPKQGSNSSTNALSQPNQPEQHSNNFFKAEKFEKQMYVPKKNQRVIWYEKQQFGSDQKLKYRPCSSMKKDEEEDGQQQEDFVNDESWNDHRRSSWQKGKFHQDSANDFYRSSHYENKRSGDHQSYRVDERNLHDDNYPQNKGQYGRGQFTNKYHTNRGSSDSFFNYRHQAENSSDKRRNAYGFENQKEFSGNKGLHYQPKQQSGSNYNNSWDEQSAPGNENQDWQQAKEDGDQRTSWRQNQYKFIKKRFGSQSYHGNNQEFYREKGTDVYKNAEYDSDLKHENAGQYESYQYTSQMRPDVRQNRQNFYNYPRNGSETYQFKRKAPNYFKESEYTHNDYESKQTITSTDKYMPKYSKNYQNDTQFQAIVHDDKFSPKANFSGNTNNKVTNDFSQTNEPPATTLNYVPNSQDFQNRTLNYRIQDQQSQSVRPVQEQLKPQDSQNFHASQNLTLNSPIQAQQPQNYQQVQPRVIVDLKQRLMKQAEVQRQLQMNQLIQDNVYDQRSAYNQQSMFQPQESNNFQYARTKQNHLDNQSGSNYRNIEGNASYRQDMVQQTFKEESNKPELTFAKRLSQFQTSHLDEKINNAQNTVYQAKLDQDVYTQGVGMQRQGFVDDDQKLLNQAQYPPQDVLAQQVEQPTNLLQYQPQQEEEKPPQSSKNFLSVFKSLKNIFSNVPNQEEGRQQQSNTTQNQLNDIWQGFSESSKIDGLFGQPQLDNFYSNEPGQPYRYPAQQLSVNQDFQQDKSAIQGTSPPQTLQKQPSTLESLRQNSRPLNSQQTSQQSHLDFQKQQNMPFLSQNNLPNFYEQQNFYSMPPSGPPVATQQSQNFQNVNNQSEKERRNNYQWKSLSPYQNPIGQNLQKPDDK